MWRDVFLNNRESVLEMLQRFSEDLTALQRAIRWGEGEALESLFRRTREIRRGVIEAHQAGSFDAREPERSGQKGSVPDKASRSEEHTSELQSLMRISYAVFCLKKKKKTQTYSTDKART